MLVLVFMVLVLVFVLCLYLYQLAGIYLCTQRGRGEAGSACPQLIT